MPDSTNLNGLLSGMRERAETAASAQAEWAPHYATDITILLGLLDRARSLLEDPLQDYQLESRAKLVAIAFLDNEGPAEIAKSIGVSRRSVYNILAEALEVLGRQDGREYEKDDLPDILRRKLTEALGG